MCTKQTDPLLLSGNMGAIEHYGLFYRGREDYLTQLGMFIRHSLASGFPVVAAIPDPEALRAGIGDPPGVEWIDITQAGRNPARLLAVLISTVAQHPGKRVHFVGEPVWPSRSDAEYPACVLHEALVNVAPALDGAVIVCPYDAVNLSPDVLVDAEMTHPVLTDQGGARSSSRFDPRAWEKFNVPLPGLPADASSIVYGSVRDLGAVRDFVTVQGFKAGLSALRTAQAVQAANEVVANTLQHTAGGGVLHAWAENGSLVLQADDRGTPSPFAGRIPPSPANGGGKGLFLVNLLCDLVRTYVGPLGLSTRLFLSPI